MYLYNKVYTHFNTSVSVNCEINIAIRYGRRYEKFGVGQFSLKNGMSTSFITSLFVFL